jgi:threonine/homoserine/homoserine lactone efflux protein
MPLETLILFVPACFAQNMAFGPNNLLSITVGARHGLRAALLAATGRMIAFVIMISVAAVGMGALLMASEIAFTIVKFLGSAYLVWLALKLFIPKWNCHRRVSSLASKVSVGLSDRSLWSPLEIRKPY